MAVAPAPPEPSALFFDFSRIVAQSISTSFGFPDYYELVGFIG